jgi:glycine/D-amino acid oxidase-like deaminating enzyme
VSVARTAPFWGEAFWRNTAQWAVQAGQYTMTPDQRPLIGPTEIDGLHVNTGYSGHGVMGGPAGSELLASILAGRAGDNPFRLDRTFSAAAQAF